MFAANILSNNHYNYHLWEHLILTSNLTSSGFIGSSVITFFECSNLQRSLANFVELFSFINIKLHAPTSSTQKLKLMGRGGQFTYIPTLPLTWRLPQASDVE